MSDNFLTDKDRGGLLILCQPGQGAVGCLPSQYFDRYAKQGAVRDALLQWLRIWAISPDTDPKATGALEVGTHEVIWCESVPSHLHGPQTVSWYAACADSVLSEIERYRPRLIIVLSNYLYQALMHESVYPKLTSLIGEPKLPAHRITRERLKSLHQSFHHCEMLVLPTPSRNTTEHYIAGLTGAVRQSFEAAGFTLPEHTDRYIRQAKACLVVDRTKSIGKIQRQFQISQEEAESIFSRLVQEGLISEPDDRGLQTLIIEPHA